MAVQKMPCFYLLMIRKTLRNDLFSDLFYESGPVYELCPVQSFYLFTILIIDNGIVEGGCRFESKINLTLPL